MKKELEEVFLTFLKDLVKQIIKTWNHLMIKNQVIYHVFGSNHSYEWAVSQYLNGFKWLNQSKIVKFDINYVDQNSSYEYILEADLEYPEELHELHSNYPLAPEKLEIKHNMLSNYCTDNARKYDTKIGGVSKLVPNLGNKDKHVLHYKNLQLYLLLGMKLIKVHRTLKFKQSDWLNKYINTHKRKKCCNSFEKDFKLMNSSVCGKTMENLRKMIKVRLVNNAKDY